MVWGQRRFVLDKKKYLYCPKCLEAVERYGRTECPKCFTSLEKIKSSAKMGNTPRQHGGHTYHSNFEARYAQELDLRKSAGEIKDWHRQVKVSLDVNGLHISNYYVDFVVIHNDSSEEYVEVKGFVTEVFRLKRLLFEATFLHDNPGIKYTVVT